MKPYKTTGIIELSRGKVGLSPSQAAARESSLRPLAGGVFEIILPVQFKAGEVISLDELEKFVRGRLECLEAFPVDAPKRFREKTK